MSYLLLAGAPLLHDVKVIQTITAILDLLPQSLFLFHNYEEKRLQNHTFMLKLITNP